MTKIRTHKRRGALHLAVVVVLAGLLAVLVPNVARGQAAGEPDWVQIGADIDGEAAFDSSGRSVAMSSDGTRIVIGAPNNNGSGPDSGHVRVYDYDGANWTQTGTDIDGEAANDWFGYSVAMSSDGNRIAIGAIWNDGNGGQSGHVRVYDFNGADWTQTGTDINGEAARDESGWSVVMSSDGSRLAIGAAFNDDNGTDSGQVRVYDFDGADWTQTGTDIDGEAQDDRSGLSVAISSDGTRIAIGAVANDDNGPNSGHVRVYDFDGADWTQTGTDIDGEAQDDWSGLSVAMSSDGSRIAIGAGRNDGNGTNSGHVRVYDFDGADWTQAGTDIDGEAANDRSGTSVAISNDGTRIAIGAVANDDNGPNSGHVRVYDFDGAGWTRAGTDINGKTAADLSGHSVAMSSDGTRIAIGAYANDDNGFDSGHVRAFELMVVEGFPGVDGDVLILQNALSRRYLDGDGVQRTWNVDTSPTPRWDAGWRLGDLGENTWSLRNRRRSRYLDADGSFDEWNVAQSVTIADDDQWEILENGDGTYLLRNTFHGRYLAQASIDNKNVITVSGANITKLAHWEISDA